MPKHAMKDIIVLLPGITGSVLEKDGKVVWGFGGKSIAKALFTRGKSMRDALMLTGDDPEADDLGDGVTATRLIPDLHLIPKVWKIDGYTKIADQIQARFDVTEGENFFQFPYDWRRTNAASARKLQRLSHDWLKHWRETSGNAEAKLILVGHSMGGLVSRYFLEVLQGWRDTRLLFTFGTPYRGSLNAVDSLVNGVRKGPRGLLNLTELSRSLTALYQLLPVYAAYDDGSGTLLRVGETTGIPNVDPERAAAALRFHREIQNAEKENRTDAEYHTNGYSLYPLIGIRQNTNQSAVRDGDGVRMVQSNDGKDDSGDGTVPRVSAQPIDHPAAGGFAASKHGSLQNGDGELVQMEGVISATALDLGKFRKDPADRSIALEVEDLFFQTEPVEFRATPVRQDVSLHATVTDSDTGAEVTRLALQKDGDGQVGSIGVLPEGAYTVRVTGEGLLPVEDAFAVGEEGDG